MAPKRKSEEGTSSTAKKPKRKSSGLEFTDDMARSSREPSKPMQSLSMLAPMFQSTSSSLKDTPQQPSASSSRRTSSSSSSSVFKKPALPAHLLGQKSKIKTKPREKKKDGVIVIDSSDDEDMDGGAAGSDELDDGVDASRTLMWTERFGPETADELAPSKTRVNPIRNWLSEALTGQPPDLPDHARKGWNKEAWKKTRRLMVLSGPAGVGKSTTLKVIAKEFGADVMEWTDEADSYGAFGQGGESSLTRLLTFISRTNYAPLDLQNGGFSGHPSTSHKSQPPAQKEPRSRVLLIPSLPVMPQPHQREAFQSAVLAFIKNYDKGSCPLVLVIPDEGLSGSAEESWQVKRSQSAFTSVHGILGSAVNHPYTCWITFPSVAPTFLTKALKRVVKLAGSEVRSKPSDEVIKAISLTANGDLRSAINSLQFLCTSGNFPGKSVTGKPATKKTGKGSRGGKGGVVTSDKRLLDMLNAITRREQSLHLFHALGKVLYNKRRGDPEDETQQADSEDEDETGSSSQSSNPLPKHLAEFERRPYSNDFDTLHGSVPVDSATFFLWLHQNLPSFCKDVDQVQLALEDICRADVMKTDTDTWATDAQAIAYAFHTAVRGVVMGLPSPVERLNQKLYKPAFFDALKQTKDSQGAFQRLASSQVGIVNPQHGQERSAMRTEQNLSVYSTEYMPFYRMMKRQNPHDTNLIDVDESAFYPFATDDPTLSQRLAILGDGDDEEAMDGADVANEEAVDATSGYVPSLSQSGRAVEEEPPQEITWLEDDDIED